LKQVDNRQGKTVASGFSYHIEKLKIVNRCELWLFPLNNFMAVNIGLRFLPLRRQIVKSLKQNSRIQKFIAFILLLVFTVSIAPRSFFHDLIANHIDSPGCSIDHKISVVHKQGFQCHCDDLVVSAPFVLQTEPLPGVIGGDFIHKNDQYCNSYFYSILLHQENRGPPLS
jgi:hypothetical protein